MATAAENLATAYNKMAERLAEITTSPKPTYTENGRTINWTEYQAFLIQNLAALREQMIASDTPWEYRTTGH